MIGNDIIDLAAASVESNPLRSGWIDKVFSISERELIYCGKADLEIIIWLLWSMKESAYKIYNRSSKKISYAPHRFVCCLHELHAHGAAGTVIFEEHHYFTKSIISRGFLHSTATVARDDIPQINIRAISNSLSELLPRGYEFVRQDGKAPLLLNTQSLNYLPVSYSHHGRWQALAF